MLRPCRLPLVVTEEKTVQVVQVEILGECSHLFDDLVEPSRRTLQQAPTLFEFEAVLTFVPALQVAQDLLWEMLLLTLIFVFGSSG